MTVAIKIRHARQAPASEQSWTVGITDPHIVVHIPDRRLSRCCVEEEEIGLGVTVEIGGRNYWTDAHIIDVFLAPLNVAAYATLALSSSETTVM